MVYTGTIEQLTDNSAGIFFVTFTGVLELLELPDSVKNLLFCLISFTSDLSAESSSLIRAVSFACLRTSHMIWSNIWVKPMLANRFSKNGIPAARDVGSNDAEGKG